MSQDNTRFDGWEFALWLVLALSLIGTVLGFLRSVVSPSGDSTDIRDAISGATAVICFVLSLIGLSLRFPRR